MLKAQQTEIDGLQQGQVKVRHQLDKFHAQTREILSLQSLKEVLQQVTKCIDEISGRVDRSIHSLSAVLQQAYSGKIPLRYRAKFQQGFQDMHLKSYDAILHLQKPIIILHVIQDGNFFLLMTYLLSQEKWWLHKVFSLPQCNTQNGYTRDISYHYILVDKVQERFIALSEKRS